MFEELLQKTQLEMFDLDLTIEFKPWSHGQQAAWIFWIIGIELELPVAVQTYWQNELDHRLSQSSRMLESRVRNLLVPMLILKMMGLHQW